jgi:adhesin transport system outer membrane protein
MKIRTQYLSLLFILLASNSGAQVVYGLKDCIGIGLDRNFSIRIARNSEQVAKNNYTLGNAGYLPTLDLTSKYGGTVTNTLQNLDGGGKNETKGAQTTAATAGVALGWTIFNGLSVHTTYKKLNELKIVGELGTQLTVENYISTLLTVYYAYIQQMQLVINMRYAVTLSKERLRIDEERYLLGSSSKLQVLQSRVYLNSDSSRLSGQIENLRATQIRLNELMAVEDMSASFVLKDSSIHIIPDLIYEKLFEETLRANTSLLIAARNKVISDYDYKLVVSRAYPYLNLSSGYSFGYGTSSTASYKNQITDGANYGVTLGFNIFDGFNSRRDIKNSAINIKTVELRYAEIEQGIRADLLTIYSGYQNNLQLIKLEEQNFETAKENEIIALERYRLGNLSGIDLREVQKSLLDAKESLLSVQYQAKLAEISLLQISGRIMDYY